MLKAFITIDLEYDFGKSGCVSIENITPKILDYFKKEKIKVTFFVLGKLVEKYKSLLKEIQNQGNEIASHGYSHKDLFLASENEIEYEIKLSKIAFEKAGFFPKGFRAPYFNYRKSLYLILKKYGFLYDSSFSYLSAYPFPRLRIFNQSREIKQIPISFNNFYPAGLPYYRLFGVPLRFPKRFVFYMHLHEFLDKIPNKQSFFDRVNTGSKAQVILEKLIDSIKNKGYSFEKMEDY